MQQVNVPEMSLSREGTCPKLCFEGNAYILWPFLLLFENWRTGLEESAFPRPSLPPSSAYSAVTSPHLPSPYPPFCLSVFAFFVFSFSIHFSFPLPCLLPFLTRSLSCPPPTLPLSPIACPLLPPSTFPLYIPHLPFHCGSPSPSYLFSLTFPSFFPFLIFPSPSSSFLPRSSLFLHSFLSFHPPSTSHLHLPSHAHGPGKGKGS